MLSKKIKINKTARIIIPFLLLNKFEPMKRESEKKKIKKKKKKLSIEKTNINKYNWLNF
jgi:hypothetical protein